MTARLLLRPHTITMLAGVFLLLAFSIGIASAQEGEDQAQLRVFHAAPDVGPVDVHVDGELAVEALDFMEATDFQGIGEGEHVIQLSPTGDTIDESFLEATIDVSAGDVITAVAQGTADDASVFTVSHDADDVGEGMARVYLVNATTDGLDIEAVYGEESESFGDGAVAFGEATNAELEPGDYSFEITVDGETATTVDGFMVEAGNTYTIFATGSEGAVEAVSYEDVMAAQTGGDTTPETDTTPEADTTPDAEMTPEDDTTPEADATPEEDMTPEADTTPETDMTPEADTTPEDDADDTDDMTPETDTTPEMDMTSTPGTGGGAPDMPQTGAGGTADGSSVSGWIALGLATLAIALGGGLIWRTRTDRPAA